MSVCVYVLLVVWTNIVFWKHLQERMEDGSRKSAPTRRSLYTPPSQHGTRDKWGSPPWNNVHSSCTLFHIYSTITFVTRSRHFFGLRSSNHVPQERTTRVTIPYHVPQERTTRLTMTNVNNLEEIEEDDEYLFLCIMYFFRSVQYVPTIWGNNHYCGGKNVVERNDQVLCLRRYKENWINDI